MKWTDDQQKAIDARDGTVLVSAAAGSGKTAVLVERVIRRLCDAGKPCGVENLLIVTFTNAAAAQMREKIFAAIASRIAADPGDKHLRRQQLMLPCANICTIDSFCINLVRENFHALGIAPDFKLLDGSRLKLLRAQAIETVVEGLHAEPSDSFIMLCNLISDSKNDEKLIDAILKLYDISRAYPFPEKWLTSLSDEFNNPKSAAESPWGEIIIGYSRELLSSCRDDAEYCLQLLEDEPELKEKYALTFNSDISLIDSIAKKLEGDSWDDMVLACSEAALCKLASSPRGHESSTKEICKAIRDEYKKKIGKLKGLFCVTESEHSLDMSRLAPAVTELVDAVLKFSTEFTRLKTEENGADFSDTLHFALRLLVAPTQAGYERTPLAIALSENYDEILVDEYQDINLAQDMVFTALSRSENNLFMVGDVKQSIYCFRQAMPEIFLARRDSMEEYEQGRYPAKITLSKNFRSRRGVTDIVNFIFEELMSRSAGGLDYDENEFLEAAAEYPESVGADTRLCLIEDKSGGQLAAQAEYAANYIENAVAGGLTFTEGSEQRPAQYKDFCVLMRSINASAGEFIKEFEARGIPFSCELGGGFLTSPEIMFIISLLRVLNNPVDDIPLAAVMLSPVFGFTPDDLAVMRAAMRKGSLYQCLAGAAQNSDEKAAEFIERTAAMRRLAASVQAGELVRRLIDETGCGAIAGAMKDSEKRLANINAFIDFANRYESAGKKDLSGFIRYIDGVLKSSEKISGGDTSADNTDAVKIMTIHKSKGLEFPVCILAACERKHSTMSLDEDLIISTKSGIGIKCTEGAAKFDTLSRVSARLEKMIAEHSEELRILYVALTRAREKLLILAGADDWQKKLLKSAANIRRGKKINPITVINFSSYIECILAVLMRHPDAHALRNAAGIDSSVVMPCAARLETEIISDVEAAQTLAGEVTAALPSEELLNEIRQRLDFVYPYAQLEGIVAKRIASKLDEAEAVGEYFANAEPAFASAGRLTPAQRGTATHRFMQFADYKNAGENIESELSRLVNDGMLTQQESEAVDKAAIVQFFSSELARRILDSEKVYKEYAFTAAIPLSEMNPEIPEEKARGEVVIIEGVADCAFVENGSLVIVDFKTDRAENGGELAERYRDQLEIYRRCLADVIGLPVSQTLIYSFRLNECIEI